MFSKTDIKPKTEVVTNTINIIGNGTSVKGDIRSNGDIRIDGTVIGSIHCKGKIVIGPNGNVEGEISCQNADVSGVVNAQLTVTELLSLKATAKLNGDITTSSISIEPGAIFTGSCKMAQNIQKDVNPIIKRQEGEGNVKNINTYADKKEEPKVKEGAK